MRVKLCNFFSVSSSDKTTKRESQMEQVRIAKMRETVRRYYERHKSDIITRKTIAKVRASGRWPRESTIERHSINRGVLQHELQRYAEKHPSTKASAKIVSRLGVARKPTPVPDMEGDGDAMC